MRVMRGSLALSDLKNTVKRGKTKTVKTSTVTTDMRRDHRRIDQRRRDLGPGLGVALDVVGQLVQDRVQFPVSSADSRMPT